jgi:hypothetical protein
VGCLLYIALGTGRAPRRAGDESDLDSRKNACNENSTSQNQKCKRREISSSRPEDRVSRGEIGAGEAVKQRLGTQVRASD